MLSRSLVAMALSNALVSSAKVAFIGDIQAAQAGVEEAFAGFARHYGNIKEGTRLAVLETTTDMVKDTAEAVSAARRELGGISGLINFHCVLRTLELKRCEQMEAYGQVFRDVPMIGFSTYGEQYVGHMNQTSTMLVLGG